MGELGFIILRSLLVFIAIWSVIAWYRSSIKIDGKRIDLTQNLINHLEEYAIAARDVDVAERLLARPGGMTWTEACHRLPEHGSNPALVYLRRVTSEAQAEDMFMTAYGKLTQVRDKAESNLELARSLVPDGRPITDENN